MTVQFGQELKRWRSLRRLSQLELATSAGVSQRHISFLETGRSKPSREMVVHLATAMQVPLRSRNGLLGAAGFAPVYDERSLDDDALRDVTRILSRLLDAHGLFPAYVVDRLWNIQLTNSAASSLTASLAPPTLDPSQLGGNALRLLLHPAGLRPVVANWSTAAEVLIARLRRELRDHPDDVEMSQLLDESIGYLTNEPSAARAAAPEDLMVPLVFRHEGGLLRFFTTIATIGAAHDVTLEELRIETLLPADESTESFLKTLSGG